jgi:hypothetical protein
MHLGLASRVWALGAAISLKNPISSVPLFVLFQGLQSSRPVSPAIKILSPAPRGQRTCSQAFDLARYIRNRRPFAAPSASFPSIEALYIVQNH